MPNDAFGDAAENCTTDATPSVRTEHDEIDVFILGEFDQCTPRRWMLNDVELHLGNVTQKLGRLPAERFSNRVLDFGTDVSFE